MSGNPAYLAKITWTSTEDSGRKNVMPVGMRYCPVIILDGVQTDQTLWSATVYNTTVNGRDSIAEVSYLSDDAPFYNLQSCRAFTLYEGQQIVATGIIL